MNSSLQNLTDIAADLNAAGKTVSIKRLPTRRPRKGETWQRQSQHGAGRACGSVNSTSGGATGATTCGGGAGMNLNKVYGIGSRKVQNLAAVPNVLLLFMLLTVALLHWTVWQVSDT